MAGSSAGLAVILLASQQFHVEAIARLHPRRLDVRLVVSRARLLEVAARGFEGAIAYDVLQARAGEWPAGEERAFEGVGEGVLEELAPFEADAKAMVDRWNWSGASMAAIHHLHLRYAEIWDRYLRQIEPELVLFHGEPHRGFDWVLYGLCQARGIPTPILSYTQIEDRMIVRGSVQDMPSPPAGDLARRRRERAPLAVHTAVEPPSGADQPAPRAPEVVAPASFYMRVRIPIERDTSAFRRELGVRGAVSGGRRLDRVLDLVRTYPAVYPNVVPDAPVTHLARKVENVRVRRLIRRSIDIYESAAVSALSDHPFVYYPLHFQPEATTLPMGGRLHDQLNNVRMLAAAVPDGWRVVVKEHPQMLRFTREWPRARGTVFYETLRDMPAVDLVPIDHPSVDLRGRARLVATTTGTVGWETVLEGKFVLVFGFPWYGTCPGVHRVGTVAECRAAIEEAIRHGFENDTASVQAWVDAFTESCTIVGDFGDEEVEGSSRPREELLQGTADGVMKWVEAHVAGTSARGHRYLG